MNRLAYIQDKTIKELKNSIKRTCLSTRFKQDYKLDTTSLIT